MSWRDSIYQFNSELTLDRWLNTENLPKRLGRFIENDSFGVLSHEEEACCKSFLNWHEYPACLLSNQFSWLNFHHFSWSCTQHLILVTAISFFFGVFHSFVRKWFCFMNYDILLKKSWYAILVSKAKKNDK